MTDTAIGVIGTLAGTIIGFGSSWIKEWLDKKKKLYVAISDPAWFAEPRTRQDTQTGYMTIYLFNSSSVNRTFIITSVTFNAYPLTYYRKMQGRHVEEVGLLIIGPQSANNFTLQVNLYGDPDWPQVNLEGNDITISYKVGKRTYSRTVKCRYTEP